MAWNYTTWADLLNPAVGGWYFVGATAARNGATLQDAIKALGPIPGEYGQPGYNPNLAKTDPELWARLQALPKVGAGAKPLNQEVAPKNSVVSSVTPTPSASQPSGYNLMDAKGPGYNTSPVSSALTAAIDQYTKLAASGNGNGSTANDLKTMIASYAGQMAGSSTGAEREKYIEMMNWGNGVSSQIPASISQMSQSQPQVQSQWANIAEKAAQLFPNDTKAQAAYAQEYQNGIAQYQAGNRSFDDLDRLARAAGERWVNDPLRFITEPIDNLISGDPTGILQGVAATGAGVTVGIGNGTQQVIPHTGMQGPNTSSGLPTGGTVNVQDPNSYSNPAMNPIGNGQAQAQQQNPAVAPGTGTSPATAMTGVTPDMMATGQGSQGPYPTPSGNAPTSTTTGNGSPTTGTTPPAAGGNWWDAVGAKEALAALGITVGAGGSLIAAKTAADGQIEAAKTAAEAAQKAIDAQKAMYDQTRDDQQPWREAGANALTELSQFDQNNPAFAFSTTGPNADPSYSWRLSEGIKALENSAAGRGTLKSGNTLKAITEYGQGAASQEYSNAYNRHMTTNTQKMNRLQSLAGIGQTAVNTTGQAGQNYINNAADTLVGGSQALAQGQAGAANAWAQGGMGAVNSLINGLSEYYQNNQRTGLANSIAALLK